MKLTFGTRVQVSAKFVRTFGPGLKRQWHERRIEPREGLYIGDRTLSNGECVDIGDSFAYTGKEYFKASLVVFSAREKPILAPIDAVTEMLAEQGQDNAGA